MNSQSYTEPFSAEETVKIQQLRSSCSAILNSEQNDDFYLIRWLRARNLDVDKAEIMLRKSLNWRKEKNIDGILDREDIPEKYRKLYPTAVLGKDHENSLVTLVPLGRYNHRIVLSEQGMEIGLRYTVIWIEKMVKIVKEIEKETGQKGLCLAYVVDMEQYSYKDLAYGMGRDYVIKGNQLLEDNYPEMLKSMLVINAPNIFALLYNLIKPVLTKATVSKISIFGSAGDTWKKEIGERCSLDKVPLHWGGTRQGSDQFCSEDKDVWLDAPIPLSFLMIDETTHGLKCEKVRARDKLEIELEVVDENETSETTIEHKLVWKFKVESHDIKFSITFEQPSVATEKNTKSSQDSSSDHIIFPECRVDSKQGIKEGTLVCKSSGTYILTFDNSYSLTRSKTVYYSAQIVPVEQDDTCQNQDNVISKE